MNAITRERHQELKTRIEPLRQQVEAWRKNKTTNEPTPETFWAEATELARQYGISPVQKILRMDYRGLERRALGIVKRVSKDRDARRAAKPFMDFGSLPIRRVEHVVELEDGNGRRLSLKVAAGHLAEVLPLAQAFWRP